MTPEEFLGVEILGLTISAIVLVILALTLLPAMWRVALGPADADRAVGADHVFFVLVASIAILGLAWERDLLFDLVLVGTLVGFISALILARFLGRRRQ
ncbi:monovalent cation/H+ antiporter complex subunit F [Nesterenkonia sandarakina]|uniref:Multicomponent Na+:H+ antiporter subunit F n=1 Tax=Nesterenkonia sandarakina TaxID=272918 RepID=A0A7Z0EAZ1_9MICC|nr:multicomponent Na+:H+ antiporter subunit F [Nesterenkonia sandarakina]